MVSKTVRKKVFKNSKNRYRYIEQGFEKITAAALERKAALICGYFNFANLSRSNFNTEENEEELVVEIIENVFYQQKLEIHTRGTKTLEVAFFRNCSLASLNEEFTQSYDCSDHKALKFFLECPTCEEKPIRRSFRRFGSAD